MEKVFVLKGLDCPHCSAKIEKEVGTLAGVSSSSVNLIKQTLTVTADRRYKGDLFSDVENIVHKHEPDVSVSEAGEKSCERSGEKAEGEPDGENSSDRLTTIRLASGAAVYALGMALYFFNAASYYWLGIFILAYIILGADVVWKALRNILKGRVFDENFLMTLSTVGAFAIGEYPEAVAVMLFYQIGEFFQRLAVKRSRRSISDLMDIRPDRARVRRGDGYAEVSPDDVSIGDRIMVKPGERIPLDGVIVSGESMLDTIALTGESTPRSARLGDRVMSGCVNQSGILEIEVEKSFGDSTASRIIDLVENASSRKAKSENFITKFARYYTPAVVILAAALAVVPPLLFGGEWAEWLRRCFVFLVISCPCALVISIPLTFFGGIGAASKRGVLVKGGNYLEALSKLETVVFDKTGTLTKGVFRVTDIIPAAGFGSDEVLRLAATAESLSNHPIARSIISEYKSGTDVERLENYEEISGHGVIAVENGEKILVGNDKLMRKYSVDFIPCAKVGTVVYVARGCSFVGCILISDEIKGDSIKAVAELKKLGVRRVAMLTGDSEKIAADAAEKIGIDEYHAGLLPDQKVEALERLNETKSAGSSLAFVGDGINDAPVLARADIGVAMGGLGSDAAIEAADVVLMTDEPSKLADALKVARATKGIVIQNIAFALGVKLLFLILGAFGVAGMWEAVFGDVGVMIIAVLNAMRIMRKRI